MKPVQAITIDQLLAQVASGAGPLILDVRSPEEFAAGHVDGAVNLPAEDLERDPSLAPMGRPLVTVCNKGGGRCQGAAEMLAGRGADVRYLEGGTNAWMAKKASPNPMNLSSTWDLVATAYAAEVTPQFQRYAADALQLAGVSPGQRVLDVACGPGTLALLAAQAGAQVDALDFSPKMIAALEQTALEQGLQNLSACCGDGQALPYPYASFDAGFSMFGLMFFPDRIRALKELRRVVRPGGVVLIGSWHPADQAPKLAALFAALSEAIPAMGAGGPRPMESEASIRADFAEAGFAEVRVETSTYALQSPSAEAFWESMERTFALIQFLKKSMGDRWPPVGEAARQSLLARLGEGPVIAEMPAFLSLARV